MITLYRKRFMNAWDLELMGMMVKFAKSIPILVIDFFFYQKITTTTLIGQCSILWSIELRSGMSIS